MHKMELDPEVTAAQAIRRAAWKQAVSLRWQLELQRNQGVGDRLARAAASATATQLGELVLLHNFAGTFVDPARSIHAVDDAYPFEGEEL